MKVILYKPSQKFKSIEFLRGWLFFNCYCIHVHVLEKEGMYSPHQSPDSVRSTPGRPWTHHAAPWCRGCLRHPQWSPLVGNCLHKTHGKTNRNMRFICPVTHQPICLINKNKRKRTCKSGNYEGKLIRNIMGLICEGETKTFSALKNKKLIWI